MPYANTEAMQNFLDLFAATLAADEHAVMVLDRAGWHGSGSRARRTPRRSGIPTSVVVITTTDADDRVLRDARKRRHARKTCG